VTFRGDDPVGDGSASGAEPLAALTTARRDDGPASTGTHAQPETVNLRPPTVVRLERTLAHWSSRVADQTRQ
jgi:hypothetical protein